MIETIRILLLIFLVTDLIFYIFTTKTEKQILLHKENKSSKAIAVTVKIIYIFTLIFLVFNTPISWFFSQTPSAYGIKQGHINTAFAISIGLIIINPIIESNSFLAIDKAKNTLPFLIILISMLFTTNMIVPKDNPNEPKRNNTITIPQQQIKIPEGIDNHSIQLG